MKAGGQAPNQWREPNQLRKCASSSHFRSCASSTLVTVNSGTFSRERVARPPPTSADPPPPTLGACTRCRHTRLVWRAPRDPSPCRCRPQRPLCRQADCRTHLSRPPLSFLTRSPLFSCSSLAHSLSPSQLRQAASEGSEEALAAVATVEGLHPLQAAGWLFKACTHARHVISESR